MKILVATDAYFEGHGGPYYAISSKLNNLLINNINFKLIFRKSDNYTNSLDLNEITKCYDIIHIYGIWQPFLAKLFYYSKKNKKKTIITPLGALEPWSLSQKSLKKKIALWVYQKKIMNTCDIIHATSEIEKENLKKLGIKNRIIVIPHGIDINYARKKYVNNKIKKAIFFSRIHEKKGLLELVEAWSKIKIKNWCLDIYGPVSDKNYLNLIKQKIQNLNLDETIKIYDPIYDLNKKKIIFESADCFLLPSKSENFGISVGEALSYGLPVLTTTSTPWKDIEIVNAGMIFEMSKENLKNALKQFLAISNDKLYQMGLNGQNLVQQKFSHKLITKKYINLYSSLM